MNEYNVVEYVEKGSIADNCGIEKGDLLLKINGRDVYDILEYKFLCAAEHIDIEVRRPSGETCCFIIDKDEYEDLGINFKYPLMSKPKSCCNKCIFCFIDQLPQGMRKTLYFKDDDSRLSFLQGNYVTLTNLTQREISNISEMKISPVNVSVHTTDGELRKKMMGHKNAGKIMDIMSDWAQRGIVMNCQIVLCKSVNDGKYLDKSIEDLSQFYPNVPSISVVPAGLSDHRNGLYPLMPFEKEEARQVVRQVEQWQKKMLECFGSRIVYLADEFYLKAGIEIPPYECYEDFPQIENGVGLIASMRDEFETALKEAPVLETSREVSIATGMAAYDFISEISEKLEKKVKNLKINIFAIENKVFGKNITVAGLVCGGDIIDQLRNKHLGEVLFLPASMLRAGENVLLDDITTEDIEKTLNIRVKTIDNDGFDFVDKLTGQI